MQRHYNVRSWLALPLLFLALFAVASGQNGRGNDAITGTAKSGETPKIQFEKYTLPNGLQVILHVDRKLPVVHVNQWYHVGSKNERPGRTGFAHLFEHMMFQGSKNASGEYFTYVEKAGANLSAGGVNGTTSFDRTNYFATVPSGNLEYLLWLESDRLATLDDAITIEKLNNQRDVVKNERRQSLENQPYGRAYKLINESLFPAGHPYSHDIIGIHEDLTAASLDDVQQFFRTYYTPNNLTITIAGDFDPAEAKKLVAKYFGGIPPGPALDRVSAWIPKIEGERIIDVQDRVPLERSYIVWTGPAYFTEGDAELDLATTILTDGISSRLQKVLMYDKQLCNDVAAFNDSREIGGAWVVYATARKGVTLQQVEGMITEEIARLAKSGPTEEELARAKTKFEYQFVSGLERIGGFGGKADRLNQYNVFFGDPDKFDADLARYRGATAENIRKAVARWIDTRNRVIIRFHPETSQASPTADIDRSTVPSLGVDNPFSAPPVQTAKLENGMEVFVVTRPELPKVAVSLGTRAGAVADPAGKEGIAQFLVRVIDAGTKSKKAIEISERFGDLGVSLSGSAGRESARVGFESLRRNLDPALGLLADVVRNPSFPESEVERMRMQLIDEMAQDISRPNGLLRRLSNVLMYGPDHPYGHPAAGTTESVSKIGRQDLVKFHETRWRPAGTAIVFVGNVSLADAVELAKKHFGSWSGGAPPAVTLPAPKPAEPGKIYIVDRSESAQTQVAQMLPVPSRSSSDFYALTLADAVWGGGGFGTRLNLNLREDKGYSYGVFSSVIPYAKDGIWFAGGGVQTDKTKESIVEFVGELKGLGGARPITEAELTTAKERELRGYSQRFESLGDVAGMVLDLWIDGRPMTEMDRESRELQRLSLGAVNDAAKKYALPEKSVMLLIGDRGKIEAGVRSLNLGEVVILEKDGTRVGQ